MRKADLTSKQKNWTVSDSSLLYGLDRWGENYFSINNNGHIHVSPKNKHGSPKIRHISPSIKTISPNIRHISPNIKNEIQAILFKNYDSKQYMLEKEAFSLQGKKNGVVLLIKALDQRCK